MLSESQAAIEYLEDGFNQLFQQLAPVYDIGHGWITEKGSFVELTEIGVWYAESFARIRHHRWIETESILGGGAPMHWEAIPTMAGDLRHEMNRLVYRVDLFGVPISKLAESLFKDMDWSIGFTRSHP